jgi:hypothetical protein
LVGTNYTVFIVEQKRSNNAAYWIGGGGLLTPNTGLVVGWSLDTRVVFSHIQSTDSNYNDSSLAYTNPVARIHTFVFDQTTNKGKSYWLNGGTTADATASTGNASLVSFADSAIGWWSSVFYNGDLGEVIIFLRALKTEERQAVEDYLSKKYNIKIS